MKAKSKLAEDLMGSLKQGESQVPIIARTNQFGKINIHGVIMPRITHTPSQIEWRARYSTCVAEWNMMTDEQKASYSAAAELAGITNYNAFISACLLVPMATEVYQSDPTKLKVTATQLEKDRTISNRIEATVFPDILNPLLVFQLNEDLLRVTARQSIYSYLKGQMKVTDGTNFMPTMDVAARAGYQRITDGINTVGGIYDYVTEKFSIATSRGAGKCTFTREYTTDQTDIPIILCPEGKRLMVVGILSAIDADAGNISLNLTNPETAVLWRHYGAKSKNQSGMDVSVVGVIDAPVILNSTQGENNIFILINYRVID